MATEVYLRRDVRAMLRSAVAVHVDLAARFGMPEAAVYSAGFLAAIRALSLALGIDADAEILGDPPPGAQTGGACRPLRECTVLALEGPGAIKDAVPAAGRKHPEG